MTPEWLAAYLALGAGVGVLAGLFGIGGGLLLVPALLFSFRAQELGLEQPLHLALGTSMAIILLTSFASARKHHTHQAVDWAFVGKVTPGIWLGTLLGTAFAAQVSGPPLALFFAGFVLLVALHILFGGQTTGHRALPGHAGISTFGLVTGSLSSLVSIGGGTFVVPFLAWCNFPLQRAIGTSAAVGIPVALGGTVGYITGGWTAMPHTATYLGYVYLPAVALVAGASMLTAPLGARLTHSLNVGLLRKLFALLLLALAVKMAATVLNP